MWFILQMPRPRGKMRRIKMRRSSCCYCVQVLHTVSVILIIYSALISTLCAQVFGPDSDGVWKWTTDELGSSHKGSGNEQVGGFQDSFENVNETLEDLQEKISQKQVERRSSFEQLMKENPFTAEADYITKLSTQDLQRKLQSRSYRASQVLRAFTAKALNLTSTLNCVTEFIPQALQWAEDLDRLASVKGPFHGLPIAISDEHNVEGIDTTFGLGKRLNNPANRSSVLVQTLLSVGMIPFVKANVPQTLFSIGSDNPLFGETANGLNPAFSPGGAAIAVLVARGAAVLGIGTDFFGSLRIPAHSHGLVALKCTGGRISDRGVQSPLPNLIGLRGVPGIIAMESRILTDVHRSLFGDPLRNIQGYSATPVPWSAYLHSTRRKLRIGFYTSLPFFPAMGDTEQTILSKKVALESEGHTLIPFPMPDGLDVMKLFFDLLLADGGSGFRKLFRNEPKSKSMEHLHKIVHLTRQQREIAAYTEKFPLYPNHTKKLHPVTRGGLDIKKPADVQKVENKRKKLKEAILHQMRVLDVDLIMGPTFPLPAMTLNEAPKLLSAIAYTVLWNLVDFPAGTIKFGTESGRRLSSYDDHDDSILKAAKEAAKNAQGMPISIQFIARPYQDELVLKLMTEAKGSSGGYIILQ